MSPTQKKLSKLHTLTFKMLYSVMDTLKTVSRSIVAAAAKVCIQSHTLMMTPIALYINAKPMGFSRVHCTIQ